MQYCRCSKSAERSIVSQQLLLEQLGPDGASLGFCFCSFSNYLQSASTLVKHVCFVLFIRLAAGAKLKLGIADWRFARDSEPVPCRWHDSTRRPESRLLQGDWSRLAVMHHAVKLCLLQILVATPAPHSPQPCHG